MICNKNSFANKLKVLSDMAHILNAEKITWAIGGSTLLYFNGKTDFFNDLDIMVHEDNIDKLKELLLNMGTLLPENPDKQYKTRHFYEFVIDEVEVDVMAGFVIVKDGVEVDCSLYSDQIEEYHQLNGEMIPLQSISDWRRYYELMGRTEKVAMIDS